MWENGGDTGRTVNTGKTNQRVNPNLSKTSCFVVSYIFSFIEQEKRERG